MQLPVAVDVDSVDFARTLPYVGQFHTLTNICDFVDHFSSRETQLRELRDLADFLGTRFAKESTFKAMCAVISRLNFPEKYQRDEDAWLAYRASESNYRAWKGTIMPLWQAYLRHLRCYIFAFEWLTRVVHASTGSGTQFAQSVLDLHLPPPTWTMHCESFRAIVHYDRFGGDVGVLLSATPLLFQDCGFPLTDISRALHFRCFDSYLLGYLSFRLQRGGPGCS